MSILPATDSTADTFSETPAIAPSGRKVSKPDSLPDKSEPRAPEASTPPVEEASDQTDQQTVRVLHVINGEHYSGAERVQDLLALRLPEFGYSVGFVSLKPGRFGDARRSVGSPLEELPMSTRWDLRSVGEVMRIAREGGYRLVHAHTPRSALVGSLAAKRLNLPFVYHVHSPTSRDSTRWFANWVNDKIERHSIRAAAKLITVSPTLTEHMRSLGVADKQIECVLNGVPAIRDAAPLKQFTGPLTLGMVALFRPRKGTEVLLEALAAVRSRGHDVRLRAIGPFETPQYEQELLEKARRLDVSKAITWTGFTDDVPGELAQVDALALPSLFGEGLPMVVLEAMAAGLPVVATHCEGVAQAVVHRETGLLVEAGSVSQFGDAIEELATGEIDYASLSRAGIERHAEAFSDAIMARNVAKVYGNIL